jgi:galectin-3-binding protein
MVCLSTINFVDKTVAVQLRGPQSSNGTGRVEVYHDGEWGTICVYGWDMNDTDVVCRELGFKYSIRTIYGSYFPRSGRVWLSDVSCTGNEHYFSECSHGGWGKQSCLYYNEVGVECSTAGNVEFYFYLTYVSLDVL